VAYFAGGCVRDRLLSREPTDYDIATDARPERVKELFPGAMSVGESFGVMLVRRSGCTIEVATFRSDGPYFDGRHPETVTFSDARSDAARRDFTINAMFEDPLTEELVDYFSGRQDLEARVLRAVGDATQRLSEDRLRVLRAVRFAARFELEIEDSTRSAIEDSANDLGGVSRERIGGELRRMLADPSRDTAVSMLESLGVDVVVFGHGVGRGHARPVLASLGPDVEEPIIALAAWMIDRGSGIDREATGQVRSSLMLSNHEHRMLEEVLELFMALRESWLERSVAARKRLAVMETFSAAVGFIEALDQAGATCIREDVVALTRTGLAPTPFIDGDVLIDNGLQPGPAFKSILERVYDAQLEGRVDGFEEALRLALSISKEEGPR